MAEGVADGVADGETDGEVVGEADALADTQGSPWAAEAGGADWVASPRAKSRGRAIRAVRPDLVWRARRARYTPRPTTTSAAISTGQESKPVLARQSMKSSFSKGQQKSSSSTRVFLVGGVR
ncbi:hypothetical protein D9V34_10140 [Mycetocola lacteus]|uniref:Uncharacterized protein n=1 Tax=Mycetocola lacteus TaxID=76637 RepID=A0A3L7AP12_9MICO|nr:hypothetical protein D9V34_10140 [Mycetocola lacteus]